MDDAEWGPWIEWGKRFATAERAGTYTRCIQDRPFIVEEGVVEDDSPAAWSQVDRYQVRIPRALADLRALIADQPEPVTA